MKVKLDINSVATKQLESAIWMYAYDYDEVAVHTIASAAFEIYTKRLGLSTFKDDVKKYIKPEKANDFISLWNKPYNFFKHGEHQYRQLDYIEYNEETVELIIYLAAKANLKDDEKFRLSCANVFCYFYSLQHPELFDAVDYEEMFTKSATKIGIDLESLKNKETLRIWLNGMGHTFLNGDPSPYRDIVS